MKLLSAACRRPVLAIKGFTLIELLVVMALMSAMAALVAPQMWKQYVSFSERSRIEHFWSQVKADIRYAHLHNRHYTLKPVTKSVRTYAEQAGLRIVSNDTILFRADGVSSGGVVLLQTERGRRWALNVAPLDGGARIEPKNQ